MQFALMNGAFFVAVQELDGIFDGEDVIGLFFVHLVEDGSERRGLAGAGGTSDQDDAISGG